eukprot:tig00020904_g15288.t2
MAGLDPAYVRAFVSLALWYVVNVATVILNKWIFQMIEFSYPLTLTAVHFLCCAGGSTLLIRVLKRMPLVKISSTEISTKLFPFSLIFCANIVLGNISIRWVPVSFMQTVKAAVPACTVLLQVFFLKVRFDTRVYVSLIPIVGGVMLASYTEANFNWPGFLSALAACWTTALQTVLSSIMMNRSMDPINLLYYMAPMSFLILAPAAAFVEGGEIIARGIFRTEGLVLVLFISGALAFLLNWSTFLAIQNTSSLTFNVSGNLKSVIAIILSVVVFRNEIGPLNAFGCFIALAGVIWYGLLRHEAAEKAKQATARRLAESAKEGDGGGGALSTGVGGAAMAAGLHSTAAPKKGAILESVVVDGEPSDEKPR